MILSRTLPKGFLYYKLDWKLRINSRMVFLSSILSVILVLFFQNLFCNTKSFDMYLSTPTLRSTHSYYSVFSLVSQYLSSILNDQTSESSCFILITLVMYTDSIRDFLPIVTNSICLVGSARSSTENRRYRRSHELVTTLILPYVYVGRND